MPCMNLREALAGISYAQPVLGSLCEPCRGFVPEYPHARVPLLRCLTVRINSQRILCSGALLILEK